MRILSWNLNGLEDRDLDVRTEAALFTMILGGPPELAFSAPPVPPPEVLLLQEVVERSFLAHVRPHLTAAGYQLWPEAPPEREYFEVIATRPPLTVLERWDEPLVATQYGRRLLGVKVEGLSIHTAHFDSMRDGAAARRVQVRHVLERLGEGPALFAGDTNLRDAEVPTDLGAAVDAWEASGSARAHRATWTRGRKRFDRAYVAGRPVLGFRTLGAQPLGATGEPASDHLAIEITV